MMGRVRFLDARLAARDDGGEVETLLRPGGLPMHRRRFLLAANLFALLTGCYWRGSRGGAGKGSGAQAPPKLAIELRAVTPSVSRGTIPQLAADLVNRGQEPVTVVLPMDGSECGGRTPVVRWTPAWEPLARCGYVSGLSLRDVMALMPGERVKLSWILGPLLTRQRRHEVSLELEHVPDMEWKGVPCPPHDPEAMKAVRGSAPWKAVSNTVEVTVR
jgi:hypothetical protein